MYIARIIAALGPLAFSGFAIAGTPNTVPEPETLALLAIGAAAVAIARRLKKK
jgi:hypothetical protein